MKHIESCNSDLQRGEVNEAFFYFLSFGIRILARLGSHTLTCVWGRGEGTGEEKVKSEQLKNEDSLSYSTYISSFFLYFF